MEGADVSKERQREITVAFAEAVAFRKRDALKELLHERGDFTVIRTPSEHEEYLKTHPKAEHGIYWVDRDGFLAFMDKRWSMYREEIHFRFDQCLQCVLGNPVVLFREGYFPVRNPNFYDRDRTGLMLEFKDDKISDITFCYAFLKTENPDLGQVLIDEGDWWPDYKQEWIDKDGLW